MGVSIVRQNGGLFPVPYVASKEILEDYPTRALNPYFFRTKLQPLTFTLTFSCETVDIDIAKLNSIASWLCQSTYKPFISEDNPNRVYYIMATNQIDFMTNGVEQGYFEIEFRCQHPYALTLAATPSYESIYDYNDPSETQFTIHNDDNVHEYFYPIFEITLGATPTSVYIYNYATGLQSTFTTLSASETLYVDNQKKIIVSSTGTYRYDNFDKEWFKLAQGDNLIGIGGYCTIEWLLQYPIWT
jgi:predicted phage tail component-like protein